MRWYLSMLLVCSTCNISAEPVAAETQGEYLFQLANCIGCHTDVDNDGKALAGGRALESDFGVFYTPNITPDTDTGIGSWSDEQFVAAMQHGEAPDGRVYYPSFPWLSYRNMKREDILAIKDYLFKQPAIQQHNRPHELAWFLNPLTMTAWAWLNDLVSTPVNYDGSRGSYLVDVLGHCNECHTPRNALGMIQMNQRLQGNKDLSAPNISPSPEGISDWKPQQLKDLFSYGELPDGDYVADHMGEVVDNSTSRWNSEDMKAAVDYLLSNQAGTSKPAHLQ